MSTSNGGPHCGFQQRARAARPPVAWANVRCGRLRSDRHRNRASRQGFWLPCRRVRPFVSAGTEIAIGIERVDALEALLDVADIVSLHCPLSAETKGIIGAEAFRRMKPNAILINTARGEIVDVSAMIAAIRGGEIAGAGIDVLPTEPPNATAEIAVTYRDLKADGIAGRLILTPHAAWSSPESRVDIRRLFGRNRDALLSQRSSAQPCERFLPANRETLRLPLLNPVPTREVGWKCGMELASRRAQWAAAFSRSYLSKKAPRLWRADTPFLLSISQQSQTLSAASQDECSFPYR